MTLIAILLSLILGNILLAGISCFVILKLMK